jgi:predicted molibdopterin-dependent oxidoreductase YjgC
MRINQTGPILPEVQRGRRIQIQVDGKPVEAFEGETVATALLAAGIHTFRLSRKYKEPRGIYCGMGVCYECLVTIDGTHALQACLTPAADGMQVDTCRELEL